MSEPHGDDIIVWPDGTYCDRRELEGMSHKSDDYTILFTDTPEWLKFIEKNS